MVGCIAVCGQEIQHGAMPLVIRFYATHRNITVHSHCLFPRTLTLYSAMCIKAAFSGLPFSWWSALAGSSREFREWARWAASNFQPTVGRMGRRTRALTVEYAQVTLLVRTCSAAEGIEPRGTLATVDLLHLVDLGWLPRSMVSAMQRRRCVRRCYQNL